MIYVGYAPKLESLHLAEDEAALEINPCRESAQATAVLQRSGR